MVYRRRSYARTHRRRYRAIRRTRLRYSRRNRTVARRMYNRRKTNNRRRTMRAIAPAALSTRTMGFGFPPMLRMKMKWFDEIPVYATLDCNEIHPIAKDYIVPAPPNPTWGICVNDIYDPRLNSVLGGQPAYHDIMQGVYQQYKVDYMVLKIRVANEDGFCKDIGFRFSTS